MYSGCLRPIVKACYIDGGLRRSFVYKNPPSPVLQLVFPQILKNKHFRMNCLGQTWRYPKQLRTNHNPGQSVWTNQKPGNPLHISRMSVCLAAGSLCQNLPLWHGEIITWDEGRNILSIRERFHYLLDPRDHELYQCHHNVLCHKETVQEGWIPHVVFVTVTVIGSPHCMG